jgi:hypothetical protein
VDDVQLTHEDATARVWYLRTREDTDGEVHAQRVEYPPGSPFPPTTSTRRRTSTSRWSVAGCCSSSTPSVS